MITMKKEKIVLVVTDGRDYSVKEVSEWLLYYSVQKNFRIVVLNVTESRLEIKNGSIGSTSDVTFGISDTHLEFQLSDIIGIFFRQAALRISGHTGVSSNSGSATDIKARLYNYLMAYESNIRWFILNFFSEKNIIGYDSGSFINKLDVLRAAAEIGLKIPNTLLTSSKSELMDFYHHSKKEVILKSIGLNLTFFDVENKLRFHQLTQQLNDGHLNEIPDSFPLTLVQEKINKEFEIRLFYLDGTCYSWALLSQSNEKTQIDYRNYDWNNPMRVVPFTVDLTVQKRIVVLMNRLGLRTGSIDLKVRLISRVDIRQGVNANSRSRHVFR